MKRAITDIPQFARMSIRIRLARSRAFPLTRIDVHVAVWRARRTDSGLDIDKLSLVHIAIFWQYFSMACFCSSSKPLPAFLPNCAFFLTTANEVLPKRRALCAVQASPKTFHFLVVALAVVVVVAVVGDKFIVCDVDRESSQCDAEARERALEAVAAAERSSVSPGLAVDCQYAVLVLQLLQEPWSRIRRTLLPKGRLRVVQPPQRTFAGQSQ